MPPEIGAEPFNIKELTRAREEFHRALGHCMGEWALIEERTSYWFQDATGLSYGMARSIFFTPSGFGGRCALLKAALKQSNTIGEDALRFISRALKKAQGYQEFRNQFAHGEQTFDVRKGSKSFKQIIMISGRRHPHITMDAVVTLADLKAATDNFRELAKLLMDMTEVINGQRDTGEAATIETSLKTLPGRATDPRIP